MNIDFTVATRGKGIKPPPPAKLYDLEAIRKKFALYATEMDKIITRATGLEVKDEAANEEATALGTRARQAWKKIEEAEKVAIAEPDDITQWNNWVKSVKALAKKFKDPLKAVEGNLKQKVADFQYYLKIKRREEEERAEEERKRLQADLDRQTSEKGQERIEIAPQVIPKTDKVTRTGTGTSHIRTEWKAFIINPKKVPREYCEPSQSLLNDAVKQGIREIEGVDIKEVPIGVFRTK